MAEETIEKPPFNAAMGRVMTTEEVVQKAEADLKASTPVEKTEPVVEEKPAEQQATNTEAAAVGTTVDAVDAFFKSDLAEKYGIKDKDELFGILESITDLKKERDDLKGRPTEPQFKSDKQKNIYTFLQEYDNLGDGMEMVARLANIDPMGMDGTAALREAYILENKDLARDQAARMFDKKEVKKYENPKKKEDYDDPAEFDEENEILKIQKERDINKARRMLIENKEKFKEQAKEKKVVEKEEPAIPPQALSRYTNQVNKFFEGFNTLKYSEDDGSNEVSIKFTSEQLKDLKEAAIHHVNNSALYKDGEIPDFDIVKAVDTFAWALHHEQMAKLMLGQVNTRAQIIKAEQIAKQTPEKHSGGAEESAIDKSPMGQLKVAAAKLEAERKSRAPGPKPPLPAG